jgi:hypothetical protein
MVPAHMREAILWWIEKGEPAPEMMGSFLYALLTNNLMEAFARADAENTAHMREWTLFLHDYAPMGCFGSKERVAMWYAVHHPTPVPDWLPGDDPPDDLEPR